MRRRRSQADRIERASRPSWSDGRTLEDEWAKLLEALRDLGRTLLSIVKGR